MSESIHPIAERIRRRRLSARDAVLVIAVAALLLLLFTGSSIRRQGKEMDPGIIRSVVLAVGEPAGWLADRLPLDDAAHNLTGWLSPDDKAGGPGSFDAATPVAGRGTGAVTPDAFDPAAIGAKPRPPRRLRTLLVTGDSMAQPLDVELARRLAGNVGVVRDVRVGTGISKSLLLDWGSLSVRQTRKHHPEAIVVFIGANEGFAIERPRGGPVDCCGSGWAAAYANRARRMMDTYRQQGAARVYWLLLPLPRDGERMRIARVVNAAVEAAAGPFRAQVRLLDMARLFTPRGRYRDSMDIDGKQSIVREPDGIHLNDKGSKLAADAVQAALDADFGR